MRLRPDTVELTLPDGKRVRVWKRQAEAIRADVMLTGAVMLVKDPLTEVYERVEPGSMEARSLKPVARHIG